MIKILEITFENILSYGDRQTFTPYSGVTQLVGENGAGKSSIPTILEEGLFNKNSRGVKKSDLTNRYTGKKGYYIGILLDIDGNMYEIQKTVASTAKVKLLKDNQDISGHTATQTYKELENILGVDFATFTKLVYQSMISSLDFLSATDANRKKFLISLLGLEEYSEKEKVIKAAYSEAKAGLAGIQGRKTTVETWLSKNSNIPDEAEKVDVPEMDDTLQDKVTEATAQINNIELHNSVVRGNKQKKDKLDTLRSRTVENVAAPDDLEEIKSELQVANNEYAVASSECSKLKGVKDKCYACGAPIDIGDTKERLESAEKAVKTAQNRRTMLDKLYQEAKTKQSQHSSWVKYNEQVEQAEAEYDSTKPTDILDADDLQAQIRQLKTDISKLKTDIDSANKHNSNVDIQNALRDKQLEQFAEFNDELVTIDSELDVWAGKVARLKVLTDSLGNKGLVAYKIESMVKVFEQLINEYLQVLADGRFALGFTVENDKLALKLYDNGAEVDIKSLSSGEFNRVNTSTLLAIRKMMTSVSKVDINLLFLDEVVSVLDKSGKDTLIEVLLREQNLDSVVVSHGYTHPLAEVVTVVKDGKVSRISYE